MVWIIYAMLAITIVVIIIAFVSLLKRTTTQPTIHAEKYDVFKISDTQFIVLTLNPVVYEINEIERITFSVAKVPRSMSSYNGVMHVYKKNGQKSRPFLFNSSAYTKKMTLASSKQEIEQTIQYLMEELKQHHIYCLQTV